MELTLTADEQEFATPLRDFLEAEFSIERQKATAALSYHERAAQWVGLRAFGVGDWVDSVGMRALVVSAFEIGRVCLPLPLISDLYWGIVAPRIAPYSGVDWDDAQVLRGTIRIAGSWKDGRGTVVEGLTESNRLWLLDSPTSGMVLASLPSSNAVSLLDPYLVAGSLQGDIPIMSTELPSGELWSGWLLVQSARIAGACSKVLSMTSAYLGTRQQFGVPIGGFQAVQQQIAAVAVLQEGLVSLIDAACHIHDCDRQQREFSALSAWRFAQLRGATVIETCLQLHGGIGFTWEYDLHWYLRAVKTLALLYPQSATGDDRFLDTVPRMATP